MNSTSINNSGFSIGEIAENVFTTNKSKQTTIVVKILGEAPNGMIRVADVRDCSFTVTTHDLIQSDKTWAVPVENLRKHDTDCVVCHKDGLVRIG